MMKKSIGKNISIVNIDEQYQASGSRISSFPFKSTLTLEYLIEYWEELSGSKDEIKRESAKKILKKLEGSPELRKPVAEVSSLRDKKNILDELMSVVYSASLMDREIKASVAPFKFQPISTFYSTPSYDEIFGSIENARLPRVDMDFKSMLYAKIIFAYSLIIEKFFDRAINFSYPLVFKVKDSQTDLVRFFKINLDSRFLSVISKTGKNELSDEDFNLLRKDMSNLSLWMEKIPPSDYEFRGFMNLTAIDVTEEELISAIKNDLLDKDTIVSGFKFKSLTNNLRSLFGLADLEVGLVVYPGNWNMALDFGEKISNSLILNRDNGFSRKDLANSIYQKCIDLEKPVIIEDITDSDIKTSVDKKLIAMGLKSILIAPLRYDDTIIGFLEMGVKKKGGLNTIHSLKLKDVISLFSIALERGVIEIENKVQAIIKEKFTAIHPSVEWKFQKLALDIIADRKKEDEAFLEEVIFKDVYPMFGMSDIRDSSDNRNKAIREDLMDHLKIARIVLEEASKVKPLHVIDHMLYRIDKKIDKINTGINSGDELVINEFIRNEIENVFDHLKLIHPKIKNVIDDYFSSLNNELGNYYARRREYENSVATINETISNYIDEAEKEAQQMYPHYFEKYKSDGVEYGIYIGESIVDRPKFDKIYLKNMRIWQLRMMCGIAKKCEDLKKTISIPLEVTHLILVQDSPLSIRFRPDEKKFDVDGTYNARYEIMKKRIDKAVIKKTGERLTQPSKIAIIYSRNKEAIEYKKYIEYLQSRGYLEKEIEEFELEDLQGVQGLRALRIQVNLNSGGVKRPIHFSEYKTNGKKALSTALKT